MDLKIVDSFKVINSFSANSNPARLGLSFVIMVAGEDGEITTAHMLLGIWSEKESGGYKVLASLGFDDQKASELAKSVSI